MHAVPRGDRDVFSKWHSDMAIPSCRFGFLIHGNFFAEGEMDLVGVLYVGNSLKSPVLIQHDRTELPVDNEKGEGGPLR